MNIPLKERLTRYNTLFTGIIAGILIPVLIYFIMYFASVHDIGLKIFSNMQIAASIIPVLISHCILPNLLLFFIFTGINWMQAAKGILGSTVVMTVLLFAMKLVFHLL